MHDMATLTVGILGAALFATVAFADTATQDQSAIYGSDGRQERFEIEDPQLQDIAQKHVVALMSGYRLNAETPNAYHAPQYRRSANLCSDEAYGDQPLSSFCSGVVIAPDLVLTAAHCFSDPDRQCERTRLVFDYAYTDAQHLASPDASDVYACREVVKRVKKTNLDGIQDWMILQLDRPVEAPHAPAVLRPNVATSADEEPVALNIGDAVVMFGFPMGLPLKMRSGATVIRPRPGLRDVFVTDLDAFTGDSGAGVWTQVDGDWVLAGILISGDEDFITATEDDKSCKRTKKCTSLSCIGENVLYIDHAIRDLCTSLGGRRIHHPLCGDEDALCGDGFCDVRERDADHYCVADCGSEPEGVCGDGVCEDGEFGECASDCALSMPGKTGCDAINFGTFDGCHTCDPPDPDCDIKGTSDSRSNIEESLGCSALKHSSPLVALLSVLSLILFRRREGRFSWSISKK